MAATPGSGLEIVHGSLAGAPAIAVRGHLDAETAPALQAALRAAPEVRAVDVSGLAAVDDAGMALLVNALRRLALRAPVTVVGAPGAVRAALARAGVGRRMTFADGPAAEWTGAARVGPAKGPSRHRPATERRRDVLLAEATLMLERDYGDPDLDLARVARRIATSRRHLQRVYAELAGTTFRHELAAVRMQRAAALLQTTDLPVSTIAARVGYRQAAQFAKAFRRHQGEAPRAFRRAARASRAARWEDAADTTNATDEVLRG